MWEEFPLTSGSSENSLCNILFPPHKNRLLQETSSEVTHATDGFYL